MNLLSYILPKLWCAGKLGNCPKHLKRFRFSCLFCRWRRRLYGKFFEPPFWITYTYLSGLATYHHVNSRGEVLATKQKWITVLIDPRGHFTMLRCAIIMALDKIILKFRSAKYPLREICEFFANYPTW